ncbi:MEDS domain-containing protein [Catellatospora vulcania]|uniref:MEDS domain-containing protein n=1 Tax=Catellatospora vulcania TaxID=1460450 RepID=UPI0018AFDCA2|nr:MEDS domain-containing protein [Catellatospora vulcania]
MRRSGFVDRIDGSGCHDHICWVFDTPEEFRQLAGRFLSEGLAAGQQVLYLEDRARETELDHVDGFGSARRRGAAAVQDLGIYEAELMADPAAPARAFVRACEQAVADGYTGLRVAADVTSLVRDPTMAATFARYEHLVDTHMARHPLTGMCGFHRARLSATTIAELACLHPLASSGSTPLRLFSSDQADISAVLAGEVDLAGRDLLRSALARIDLPPVGGEVIIDARELSFIDHQGLLECVEHIRGRGAATVLHLAADSATRLLLNLLRLPDVRVVTA